MPTTKKKSKGNKQQRQKQLSIAKAKRRAANKVARQSRKINRK